MAGGEGVAFGAQPCQVGSAGSVSFVEGTQGDLPTQRLAVAVEDSALAFRNRGPKKVVTTALGILLIAERAALLSGRDDEFVAVLAMGLHRQAVGRLAGRRGADRPRGR